MAYNPSLAKFTTRMKTLKEQMRHNYHQRVLATAQEIADNMRAAAPKDKGVLADSVRVIDNSRIGRSSARISVKVKAGGPTTVRRSASGEVYDYSAAVEFGTQEMQAEPFFYNTFRRYRAPFLDQAAETLEETIERNEKIRTYSGGDRVGGRHQNVVVGKQSKG